MAMSSFSLFYLAEKSGFWRSRTIGKGFFALHGPETSGLRSKKKIGYAVKMLILQGIIEGLNEFYYRVIHLVLKVLKMSDIFILKCNRSIHKVNHKVNIDSTLF